MRGAGAGALKRLGNISGFYSPRFTLILLIPYTRVHAHPRAHVGMMSRYAVSSEPCDVSSEPTKFCGITGTRLHVCVCVCVHV